MQSSNTSSPFILADHKHHQAQRLSATTQERLRERWKVSLCKRSHRDPPQSTTAAVKKKKTFKAAAGAGAETNTFLILTEIRRGQESGLSSAK